MNSCVGRYVYCLHRTIRRFAWPRGKIRLRTERTMESGENLEMILHRDGRFTAMIKPVSSMENHIACVSATAWSSA